MVEVLITVFILAVGLLGLASLQSYTVKYNHSAYLRSVAVTQLSAMADRMRANPNGVKNGDYNSMSGIPGTPNCGPCTSAQVATLDLTQWNTDNAALLPNGQGTTSRNGNIFTIVVRWDNNRSGATGTACSGNPAIDLTCLRLDVEL